MSQTLLLSVAVITHNRKDSLLRCLDSILCQKHPPENTELIVLDDASTDGTADAVQALFKQLAPNGVRRLVFEHNETPKHSSTARSQALAMISSTSDWVLSSDDDLVLGEGALATMLEAGRDPTVGIIGPKIVFLSHPNKVFSCANFVGPWIGRYRQVDSPIPIECHWLNSSISLIRGETLKKAKPHYQDFYTAHEEVDYCLRVRLAGYRVLYLPTALAYHDTDTQLFKPERLYYLYRNKYIVFRRTFSGPRQRTAIAFHSTFGLGQALLRLLWRTLTGRRNASETLRVVLAAFWDGLMDRRGPREL